MEHKNSQFVICFSIQQDNFKIITIFPIPLDEMMTSIF